MSAEGNKEGTTHMVTSATAMSDRQPAIDVDTLMSSGRIRPLQYLVFVICALVALLDGMDSQSIGVAGPLMATSLHMTMAQFAPAISAGLFGATIGALSFGGVADRFGRKPVLLATTTLFGVFTLLTATQTSFTGLIVLRFIAGLGLGGATPCFITMAAEYAPSRQRTAIASLLWAAYPLGNAVGGFASGYVVSHMSWPMVFLVAGAPTMVLAALMALLMPESLRWVAARRQDLGKAARIARRLDPSIPDGPIEIVARGAEDLLAASGPGRKMGPLAALPALFSDGRAVGTLLLWIVLCLGFATTTVMTVMSPTLLHADGIDLGTTGILVGVYSIMSMCGMAVAGQATQKLGVVAALVPAFLVGAGFLTLLGNFHDPVTLGAIMAIIGFSAPLGVAGGVALAPGFYPTEIRSSGVGWGMGLGRFGQVCSPLIIGLLLGLAWAPGDIMMALAMMPFLAGIAVLTSSWSLRSQG